MGDESSAGWATTLRSGGYSLARTYWLYGVLIPLVPNFVIGALSYSTGFLSLVLFAVACWYIGYLWVPGVWIAARRYKGLRLWAVLAQIVAVLNVAGLVLWGALVVILF